MPRYTSVDRVQRRLPGRVNLSGVSTAFGQPGVDTDFVSDMIDQCEASVDSHLRQRYQYPLTLSAPETALLIGGIVERLVAAEIVDAYYWTEEHAGKLALRYRDHALKDLEAISSGDRALAGETVIQAGSSRVPSFSYVTSERPAKRFDDTYNFDDRRHEGRYRQPPRSWRR